MLRKSLKPVISKISITIWLTWRTAMDPCLFMAFCALSSTLSPAEEMYSRSCKSSVSF